MESARAAMVREQLRPNGIFDERVLEVMGRIPREAFLPAEVGRYAYEDRALPIGHGQTMSQPVVVAAMTQALALQPGDRVLEVGTGSGYQAAVLGALCARVVTIELDPVLAEQAATSLRENSCPNVQVLLGDGRLGWPPEAPYQAILVAAAARDVPTPLIEQLELGGRMAIPVGQPDSDNQELRLLRKSRDGLSSHVLFPVRFVPLLHA